MEKKFQLISRYVIGSILLILAVYSFEGHISPSPLPRIQVPEATRAIEFVQSSEEELGVIASLVNELLRGVEGLNGQEIATLDAHLEGIYISLRADAIGQSAHWAVEGSLNDLLIRGLNESVVAFSRETIDEIDSVELCLIYS